jgi:hypothetical protein
MKFFLTFRTGLTKTPRRIKAMDCPVCGGALNLGTTDEECDEVYCLDCGFTVPEGISQDELEDYLEGLRQVKSLEKDDSDED